MRRVLAILMAAIISLMSIGLSFAQQPGEPPIMVQGRVFQGPEGAGPAPPGNTFVFVASEMGFGGKVVKGAPYSAEAVTETIQTLSDGNRIVNRTTSMLYRDSEGRTRREQTLKSIGAFASGGEPIKTIFINDPVAGVSYALDTRTNVAHKNTPLKLEKKLLQSEMPGVAPKAERRMFEYRIQTKRGSDASAPDVVMTTPGEQFSLRSEAGPVGLVFKTGENDKNIVKESLGRQIVEGVEAEGTRTTLTIPAGEIGNERPILVVSERWYSNELQMVVMSKHSDPRSGETVYRLANLSRIEPDRSLFEVPAGFTISEGFPGLFKAAPAPARLKRLVNPE